ncbi:MAG: hypothetical protein DDT19_00003 [Syntrophomonadaceae bacterium]|nr:hypothetical protein [Bacillota bacterium]
MKEEPCLLWSSTYRQHFCYIINNMTKTVLFIISFLLLSNIFLPPAAIAASLKIPSESEAITKKGKEAIEAENRRIIDKVKKRTDAYKKFTTASKYRICTIDFKCFVISLFNVGIYILKPVIILVGYIMVAIGMYRFSKGNEAPHGGKGWITMIIIGFLMVFIDWTMAVIWRTLAVGGIDVGKYLN